MRDIKVIVGENAKRYREVMGLSITQLAKKIGLSWGSLSKIENGERNCSLEKAQTIANALGVKVIDLVEDWSEEE
jgi:transcriptional regulator with XRE-family HTH domain